MIEEPKTLSNLVRQFQIFKSVIRSASRLPLSTPTGGTKDL